MRCCDCGFCFDGQCNCPLMTLKTSAVEVCCINPSIIKEHCEHAFECKQRQEDADQLLIEQIKNAVKWVRYHEAAEGEWGREVDERLDAKRKLSELLEEASKRKLKIQW